MEQNYNNSKTQSTLEGDWPRAWGIYKHSRDAISKNVSTYLLVVIGSFGILFALGLILQMIFGRKVGVYIYDVVSYLIVIWVTIALVNVYLASVRGKSIELEESIKTTASLWGRMLLLQVLIWLTIIGGLILLIVPGIIFQLRLSLATYYLVDKDMSVMEAYKASWEVTKGNLGKIWGLVGVKLLFYLLWFVLIGIYLTIMYTTVFAYLYEYLEKNKLTSTTNPKS